MYKKLLQYCVGLYSLCKAYHQDSDVSDLTCKTVVEGNTMARRCRTDDVTLVPSFDRAVVIANRSMAMIKANSSFAPDTIL